MKINKSIEIVSSNHKYLSSMSASSREAIYQVLSREYEGVRITLIDEIADLEALRLRKPDLVFLGMKYLPVSLAPTDNTEKIWLAEYLAEYDIACSGSPSLAHQRERSKPIGKRYVAQAGLMTAEAVVISKLQTLRQADITLPFPVFAKPAHLGGGEGIDSRSIAYDYAQLQQKVAEIQLLGDDTLIETYLTGREYSVGIMRKNDEHDYDVMPIELVAEADASGLRILSQAVKSANSERVYSVPAGGLRRSIEHLALAAFSALGGKDYGRIDIRLDYHDTPHFLEANLIPSLIRNYGSFPKCCELIQGIDYDAMIRRITDLALSPTEQLLEAGSMSHIQLSTPRAITA